MGPLGQVLAGMVWMAAFTGCGKPVTVGPRDGTDENTGGATTTSTGEGGLFSTGGSDETSPPPRCDGDCWLDTPDDFDGISIYFIGPPESALPCPDVAPHQGGVHFTDLQWEPAGCPACSCSPAACALPQAMHVSSAPCANAGSGALTPFDPPGGGAWEGVCTNEDAIPAGQQCGGAFCVNSLIIEAPAIEPCKPVAQGDITKPPPAWGMMARECKIEPLPRNDCDTGQVCAPSRPEGFRTCLHLKGDHPKVACPQEDFTERFVVYAPEPDDTRECSPCQCGDPAGAECSAKVSVYKDEACGAWLGSYTVTSAKDQDCFDLPPGASLESKEASFLIDTPGTCVPSESKPGGSVTPAEPVTLCCTPEAKPSK